MDNFSFFFNQGLSHISDIGAYDHILFIVALAALFSVKQWKALLILVTAFTIGHSIALALATFEVVKANSALVEFLIPMSIILTCIWNLIQLKKAVSSGDRVGEEVILDSAEAAIKFHVEPNDKFKYGVVTFFGIIHGLGFSNYLRFILTSEEGIFTPLLAFNIGLEVGQILILAVALIINFIFLELIKIPAKYWVSFVSILVIMISIPIAMETGQALFWAH